jgi:membrane fusion protein (multidrug efflux system)
VRVALDARELAAHPLQIGLSMRAQIDTHDRNGPRLPELARSAGGYATDVFAANDLIADQRVHSIIIANEAGTATVVSAASSRLAHQQNPVHHLLATATPL